MPKRTKVIGTAIVKITSDQEMLPPESRHFAGELRHVNLLSDGNFNIAFEIPIGYTNKKTISYPIPSSAVVSQF